MPTRVLLADDHSLVRQGLTALLAAEGFTVVGEAADGYEALARAEKTRPEVAVLDFAMPRLNGLDTAREMAKVSPNTRIVLLTVHAENQYVLGALAAGVKGYVLKTQAADSLVRAIREVSRDTVYLSPGVSDTVVSAYLSRTPPGADPLTARERQVLQLVAEGMSTKEVAAFLNVSFKTAESHRTRIMSKLDIHGTAGLVRYAIRQGIIQP